MLDLILSIFTTGIADIDVLSIINSVFGVIRSLLGVDKERYVL